MATPPPGYVSATGGPFSPSDIPEDDSGKGPNDNGGCAPGTKWKSSGLMGPGCYGPDQTGGEGPNNCPPDRPYYTYGACRENPNGIECDDGTLKDFARGCAAGLNGTWCDMSTGTWRCDPNAKGDPGKGGGNVPGSGLNLGQYATPNKDILALYGKKTPEEIAALNSVSSLARLLQGQGQQIYQIGAPAYAAAMQYYQALLSGDKGLAMAAIAPEAQQLTDLYSGARAGVEAGNLRGGARDSALAAVGQQGVSDIANLIPQARQGAAASAGSGGLAGATLGTGLEGNAAALDQGLATYEGQNRQFAIGAEQANRFGAAQIALSNKSLDLQKALGFASLDLQKQLGFAGLAQSGANLSQQASQFQQNLELQKQYLAQSTLQIQNQQKQASGAKWGALAGTAITGAVVLA